MKKLFFSILALFLALSARSQSCLPNGITFTTQAEVDNFPIGYPGCAEIAGDVEFFGEDIHSFSGLSGLTSIGGFLRIYDIPSIVNKSGLTSVQELISLTSIGGTLYVRVAPVFTSFHGLEKLDSIGGFLRIEDKPELATLEGLVNLVFVGGPDLFVRNNPQLSDCAIYAVCNALFVQDPGLLTLIYGNAPGCATHQEARASCHTIPADAATYRMEATKFDDGTLAATAIESCAGLTPGLITAFWLDKGPPDYDFDCREVLGSFGPNQKTAVPAGAGDEHAIVPNRPLEYTIDFQNTGTDTAFRVLLRDVLPPGLDINTFRPGFASHPYTWEIRGADTLDVLFFPVMLPDSNVNEPASHGFFSFTIGQGPDLPDGSILENKASIIFDFNPPIVTNTVRHTIRELLIVRVDEPRDQEILWRVLGNPMHQMATFQAKAFIAGAKRFELYDAAGRMVRSVYFEGQQFEFHRGGLPEGVYFFRISSLQRAAFTGKILVGG